MVPRGVGILLARRVDFLDRHIGRTVVMTSLIVSRTNRKFLYGRCQVSVHVGVADKRGFEGPRSRSGNSIRYCPWASVSPNACSPPREWPHREAPPLVSETVPESVNVSCPHSEAPRPSWPSCLTNRHHCRLSLRLECLKKLRPCHGFNKLTAGYWPRSPLEWLPPPGLQWRWTARRVPLPSDGHT